MSEAYRIWLTDNGDREDPDEELETRARLDAYCEFLPNECVGNEDFAAFNAGWRARAKYQAHLDEMNRPGEAPGLSPEPRATGAAGGSNPQGPA